MNDYSLGLSASRFYMWRTIFAFVHADDVVTPHEVSFLNESTENLPLSPAQREVLRKDLSEPQDIEAMFGQITEAKDREDLFILARLLCWSDGDFDAQEKKVLEALRVLKTQKDADALLSKSKLSVQDIRLDKSQWDASDEKGSVFKFMNRLMGAAD